MNARRLFVFAIGLIVALQGVLSFVAYRMLPPEQSAERSLLLGLTGVVMLMTVLMGVVLGRYVQRVMQEGVTRLLRRVEPWLHESYEKSLEPNEFAHQEELLILAELLETTRHKLLRQSSAFGQTVETKSAELDRRIDQLETSRQQLQDALADMEVERVISRARAQDLMIYKQAVEYASDQVIIADIAGRVIYANRAVEATTGYALETLVFDRPNLWALQMTPAQYQRFWTRIREDKQPFEGVVEARRKDGSSYMAEMHVAPIFNEQGNVISFVDISRDVTQAREVDRMKTEFISLASHQLRTPLTGVKYFIELLADPDLGELNEEQQMYLENIKESNDGMIDLVNALLDISRLEAGRLVPQPEDLDLVEVINDVAREMTGLIEAKPVEFNFYHDSALPMLTDRRLLIEAIENLLSNAIKYSPAAGRVTVEARLAGDRVHVEVRDNGVGIPEDQQARMFEKFFRARNAMQEEADGNGLGLYLVRAIIQTLDGEIGFRSTEGQGTTFHFTLPQRIKVPPGLKRPKFPAVSTPHLG